MASLGDELKRLRKQLQARPDHVAPMEVRVHLKQLERYKAVDAGLKPPAYTESELRYLYYEDLADAAGEGTIAAYRDTPGWQDSEAQDLLDSWQQDAARRVELVEELGEEWRGVYQHDLVDVDAPMSEGPLGTTFDRWAEEDNELDERNEHD
jgi:hypothetical protein